MVYPKQKGNTHAAGINGSNTIFVYTFPDASVYTARSRGFEYDLTAISAMTNIILADSSVLH